MTNKEIVDSSGGRYVVRNLQRIQISLDLGTNKGWTYFTFMPRYGSVCKAPTMAADLPTQFLECSSTRSHIHGSNRNRIDLHVMLNGRRNFTRR